jgi:membrane-bound metal-dependent hydrolase YbcI (DUF457 family)
MDPLAHASIGLMAKPLVPKAPLWALIAATQVPDLLSFAFMAAGIEYSATTQMDLEYGLQYLSPSSIAWSHGFFMTIVWSLLAAAIAQLFFRDRRTSLIIGLLVFSHWLLDFIVYRYIPVLFDNTYLTGLGLITSPQGLVLGILMEVSLIGGGIAVYWRARKRAAVPM